MNLKLVCLDLDGTLLPGDTAFAAILREAGREADVAASDERFFAGSLSLEDCFWQQWGWVQDLELSTMHRGLRKANWLQDIGPGVRLLHEQGVQVCLLTDQPSVVTDFLGRWGLTDAICSPTTIKEGRAVSVDARFDKWANLAAALQAQGISPDDVVHVGNGANDVPVWAHVGGSVAVFAEPEVAQKAQVVLESPASLLDVVHAINRKWNAA